MKSTDPKERKAARLRRLASEASGTPAAISVAEAQRQTDYSSTVDRAWARFCGAFGDGPDAPYPGMIASFEIHYGQSFRDKEWRTEASCWAAAWHKATELATKTNPQAKEIER